ncbi:MAG: hypothetical protein U9Q40_03985 [Campylobacterota bacterium]|nr:hypothetical protein [Campylobacterota bacterium]
MNILLIVLVFASFLYSDSIDSLLHDYAQESELSKKTKDESAGNLIVYTRDDLERMQVESLKDILKSLRFFQYAENRLAQPDILNQDPLAYYSKGVRIYLDEYELLSSLAGSGLILFGDMEMDFINHVEIYEGFPSFESGVEPATIVIRLYTKDAQHDEGGRVKATIGSHGANKENVYYSSMNDNFAYFFYANRSDDKKDRYKYGAQELKRDLKTDRFFGSLKSENHTVAFHAMKASGDAFLGSAVGSIPKETSKETEYLSLSTNSKLLNDSLTLNLSYINSEANYASEYSVGVPFHSYEQTIKESSFTASLKKVLEFESQTITVGLQYRYKQSDLTDLKFNGVDDNTPQPYKIENIYSVFLEDSLTLNENNLVTISLMNQEYVRKGDVENQNTTQLRLGYIYTNSDWVSKTFISSQEFASEPYMTVSPHYGNTELEPESYTSIFQELSYATPSTLSKIVLGFGENKDTPILIYENNDPSQLKIINGDIDILGYSAAVEFTLYFSQKDKLELKANYIKTESPYGNADTEHYNYVVRVLNTLGKFDIFNELVINTNYSNVDNGYDYSAGVKYSINRDLHLSFKGDNIFNTGLEQSFLNGTVPLRVEVPRVEQRFTLGLEYLF